MTVRKSTAPKDPLATGDCTEYQHGLVKKLMPNFPKKDASSDVFRAYFHALSVEGRIEKLRQQIADMGLEQFEGDENDLRPEQFREELARIELLYKNGSLRELGKNDPLLHAMRALERWVDIADTEQFVPAVEKAEKFSRGKPKGAIGYFRKLVINILAARESIPNDLLWVALKNARPEGWGTDWNLKDGEYIRPGPSRVGDDDEEVQCLKFNMPDTPVDAKKFTKKSMLVYASQERKKLQAKQKN